MKTVKHCIECSKPIYEDDFIIILNDDNVIHTDCGYLVTRIIAVTTDDGTVYPCEFKDNDEFNHAYEILDQSDYIKL